MHAFLILCLLEGKVIHALVAMKDLRTFHCGSSIVRISKLSYFIKLGVEIFCSDCDSCMCIYAQFLYLFCLFYWKHSKYCQIAVMSSIYLFDEKFSQACYIIIVG